ncbi:MAG: alpha/beta fold hydrolase [Roseivirga sp.]
MVYKVLKAKTADTTKAPIVFLQGGPGGSTLSMEEFWENNPLRNDRDIILMDQRGTGASAANCIEIGEAMFAVARQDLDIEGQIRALDSILSRCKETMKQDGVDLTGYNSKENAADFEDLRKALGYEKWDLFGSSYGSRLGLTIMRDFPKGVRSAILAGILAPEVNYFSGTLLNFENALFSVFERCEQNEDCDSRYPGIKDRMLKALKKLQSDPLHIDFEGQPFVLNPDDALLILFISMYERSSMGYIPLLIEAIEDRETKVLASYLVSIKHLYNIANWAMNYSVMAYEELPFYDELAVVESLKKSEIAFPFTSYSDSGIKLMSKWHSSRASEIENQPVVSEIPTLMVSAGLDHVTPVSNAKEAIQHLKNGYELIFPDEGHSSFYNTCFFQIAEDFLNNPDQRPDIGCSSERQKIPWFFRSAEKK